MTETVTPLELRITRVLPATPEEVFDAYTDAEKQKIWFSILDERPGIVEIDVDLRVGGTQTAVWGPDADTLFRETQTFLEIDRPHRLVTSSTGSSPDGMTMTTRIEITFEPRGRRRDAHVDRAVRVPGARDPRLLRRRGLERRAGADHRLPRAHSLISARFRRSDAARRGGRVVSDPATDMLTCYRAPVMVTEPADTVTSTTLRASASVFRPFSKSPAETSDRTS